MSAVPYVRDAAEQFRDAAETHGLTLPDSIEPHKVYRFPGADKPHGNTAGWCVLFADGLGGSFGDWSTGLAVDWQAKRDRPFTPAEREAFRRHAAEAKAKREIETEAKHAESAKTAAEMWTTALPVAGRYPYLDRKGVKPHDLRVYRGDLVIDGMVCDGALIVRLTIGGKLHSLQFIDANGNKRFLPGGRVTGCYSVIGTVQEATARGAICVAEGWATAATIREATGIPTVAAFSAGNLVAVVQRLRTNFPDVDTIVCGDRDKSGAGQRAATEAQFIGAHLALPEFNAAELACEHSPTDFNDLCLLRGAAAVRAAIAGARVGATALVEEQPPPETGLRTSVPTEPQPPTPKRKIRIQSGELTLLVHEAEAALIAAGAGIYQRGGQLVRIAQLDQDREANGIRRVAGSAVIIPVSRDYLTLALSGVAEFEKFDGRTNSHRPVDPPPIAANSLLAISGEWNFCALSGIVAAPTLRADGTLLDLPGYDPASRLFAEFTEAQFPRIAPKPSREDALTALASLWDTFSEFEFSGGSRSSHAAVAIAATITACIRHALATAPAFGVSAHKQGSGKTTLARGIAQIAMGRDPPVISPTADEGELRKAIFPILMGGDQVVLLDNFAHPVDSPAFCAVLTAATYKDRVLGASQTVTVPTAVTWLLTGNHLEFVGDLTSRVLLAVLDPQCEHPEARPFRRDLTAHIREHRAKLVCAALTIALAYVAAGSPAVNAPRSRFTEWDALVRRPLLWLEVADPLDTQREVRAADPVREGLVSLLVAWHAIFRDQPTTVSSAIHAAAATGMSEAPRLQLQLLEALLAVAGERNGTVNARRLGRYLVRHLRRIEDGLRLEDPGSDPVSKTRRFRVVAIGPAPDVAKSDGVSGVFGISTIPSQGNDN